MPDSPPAALLLLREGDVVRTCGLAAVARAMDVVRARGFTQPRRDGLRLSALVHVGEHVWTPWAEVAPESRPGVPGAIQWGCSCAGSTELRSSVPVATSPARLGCDHVAALLMAWIRQPATFTVPSTVHGSTLDGPAPRHNAPHAPVGDSAPRSAHLPEPHTAAPVPGRSALDVHLQGLSDEALSAVAERVLDTPVTAGEPRAALVARIRSALGSPDHLADMLQDLEPTPRAILHAVVVLGGAVTAAELDGIAQRARWGAAATTAATRTLLQCCLLMPAPADARVPTYPSRQRTGWQVPPDVLHHLTPGRMAALAPLAASSLPWIASQVAVPQADVGVAPAAESAVQAAPLRQLCATFALLAHTPGPMHPRFRRSAPEHPTSRMASARGRGLPPLAGEPPEAAVASWARGAQVPAGMARMGRRVLQWAHEAEGEGHALLALDRLPAEEWPVALRTGFRIWLGAESHAELVDLAAGRGGVRVRCDPAHPAFRPAALAAENAAGRRFAARVLAHMPVGVWHPIDALVELVWRLDPLFLRGRQRAFDTPAWWLEDTSSGRPLRAEVRAEWSQGEARYLRALLAGPLHWWGIVDLESDQSVHCRALRVTDFGAFLLGNAPTPPAVPEVLTSGWGAAVIPVGEAELAVHPIAAGPAVMSVLRQWARVTRVADGRLVYRCAKDLFCASLDAVRDPGSLLLHLRALDARDHTRSAPVVEALFAGWRQRYGSSRIATGVVVLDAVDEPTLREALSAAPELAERCRFIARNQVVLPESDLPALRSILERHGYVL